jgi:hypothetical protein
MRSRKASLVRTGCGERRLGGDPAGWLGARRCRRNAGSYTGGRGSRRAFLPQERLHFDRAAALGAGRSVQAAQVLPKRSSPGGIGQLGQRAVRSTSVAAGSQFSRKRATGLLPATSTR